MKKIAVLQRGWVVVGDFSQDGTRCSIDNGAVIRYWGTDKGLGQLAEEGPRPETKLDPIPHCEFHELTVVMTLDCKETSWRAKL